jgi:hypothetical protein
MSNGPRAVEAAYRAMLASLDAPLLVVERDGCESGDDDDNDKSHQHYELRVDAKPFWPE